jgi:transcriptional regulator with XRE-family HTH domain
VPPRRRLKARSPEHAALGEAIRRTRKRAELSQEQLADRAEINPKQVGILERGTGNPSYLTLARVASALEIRIGELTMLADRLHDQRRLG